MISVRELAKVAHELDGFAFAAKMGPFVLMQRPKPGSSQAGDWMTSTAKLPEASVSEDLAPVELLDLLCATLPPPQKDGTLQLVIGRAPDCDVVITDDPGVSSKHAAILWDGRAATLRELGSVNGTYLNGMKVGSRAVLRTGDALKFGSSHFTFLRSSELHAKLLKVP